MESLNLPYYNSTSYPLAIKEQLAKLPYTDDDAKVLRYHQYLVKEFFTKNRSSRGLLIAHGMGQGKTRLAVAIADSYRLTDKRRKIIVMLSKSLEGNFRNTINGYIKEQNLPDDYIDKNYKFVSLNASNMFKQVTNIDKNKKDIELEKRLGDFMDDVKKNNSLDNSLLIIDEAHNLFNAITNGAKNATALYDLIMESKNLKLMFLTGTPVINDPFELVPCFNMLRGYIYLNSNMTGGDDGDNDNNDNTDTSKNDNDNESDNKSDNIEGNDKSDNDTSKNDNDNKSDNNSDNKSDADTSNIRTNSNTDNENNTGKSDNDTGKKDNRHTMRQSNTNPDSNRHTNRDESKKHFANALKNKYKNKNSDRTLLFSEMYDEFADFFIDRENRTIKNKDKFMNRIYGLSSYYGDIYFPSDKEKEGFPKKLPTIVEKVKMSETQYSRYIIARNQEVEETKQSYKTKASRFSASSGGNSTYRVKSRQISNYCIPEYALGPVRGAKAREKFIDRITLDDLQNTAEWSPKMGKVLHNIGHHSKSPGMIYSQFVSGEGLGIFARVLEANGYVNFSDDNNKINEYDMQEKNKKYYATLSGEITPEERIEIIKQFNRSENSDGSIIGLLLLSGAVAEGIDLKRIRHVHIMEPFWNYARINQVETRAIRYLSHTDLPLDQQNVQVYIYLSDYPDKFPKAKIKEFTTDVDLYQKSLDNMKIITEFMRALAEASIDCGLHYDKLSDDVKSTVRCLLCAPTNEQLFYPIINKDMTLPSVCKPHSEKKVKANEIIYEETGEKYYFKRNPLVPTDIDIYMFNKKLNGFTPMLRSYPHYGAIMEKILEND